VAVGGIPSPVEAGGGEIPGRDEAVVGQVMVGARSVVLLVRQAAEAG